jgi:hypothetical protein
MTLERCSIQLNLALFATREGGRLKDAESMSKEVADSYGKIVGVLAFTAALGTMRSRNSPMFPKALKLRRYKAL